MWIARSLSFYGTKPENRHNVTLVLLQVVIIKIKWNKNKDVRNMSFVGISDIPLIPFVRVLECLF